MRVLLSLIVLVTFTACDPPGTPSPGNQTTWDTAPAFWIWNRSHPLSAGATADLAAVGSHRVYWQLVDVRSGPSPRSNDQLAAIRGSATIPVIRLPTGADTLTDPHTLAELRHWCGIIASDAPRRRLQIDYDCPTASLEAYAMLLASLRAEFDLETLSVTALASWINAPGFAHISSTVDELVPMFYDLAAD